MGSINTPTEQPAKKYLEQAGRIIHKNISDREKVDAIAGLVPPDDTSINADFVYFQVSPWGTPEGMDTSTKTQRRLEQAFPVILSGAERAIADYEDGNIYRGTHVWKAYYNAMPAGVGVEPLQRRYEKTLSRSITKQEYLESEHKAIASFPKSHPKTHDPMDYVTYEYYMVEESGKPIYKEGPEPVEIS